MELLYDHLTDSYNMERQKISEKDYDESYIITVDDVLKAHYLICEYFENETGEQSLYGVKNYNLLSSAVARQSVSNGNGVFNFAFISSLFKGNVGVTLQRIALDTGVGGVAINVINLLLIAENLKSHDLTYGDFYNQLNANSEIRVIE